MYVLLLMCLLFIAELNGPVANGCAGFGCIWKAKLILRQPNFGPLYRLVKMDGFRGVP